MMLDVLSPIVKGPKYARKNASEGSGTYLTFFGCPFFLTLALAAQRACICIG